MKLKLMIKILSLLFLLIFSIPLYSQNKDIEKRYKEIYLKAQREYGIDQELVSGIYYENKYYKSIGHPFFLEDEFYKGELVFKGKVYDAIEMKYDVYEQQLLINYLIENKSLWIILPNEFISEFRFNNAYFKKYHFEGMQTGFYQVIGTSNSLKCLYFWSKNRNDSDHLRTHFSYEFTKEKKTSYLLIDDKLIRYYNNSSFLKQFPEEIRSDIKKYINSNNIKVMKGDDNTIEALIDFCCKLKAPQ